MRGLVPADAYTLAAVNEEDTSFSCFHSNCTVWKNNDGTCGNMTFARSRYNSPRDVSIDTIGNTWGGRWWFAGVRKAA